MNTDRNKRENEDFVWEGHYQYTSLGDPGQVNIPRLNEYDML